MFGNKNKEKKRKRFEQAYRQAGLECFNVIVDTETGVNYLVYLNGSGSSITPLLDSHGKPIVTPVIK